MEGSTAKTNIDHLVYLGIHTQVQARKWQDMFKKNPIAKCMGCNNKIRITDPISKTLNIKYYSHRHIPEVHWVFDFQLNPDVPEAVEQCKEYIKTLSNNKKKAHIYPCCYKCWDIAVYKNMDYFTENIDKFYKQYQLENPQYVNWNVISLQQCENEEQKQAKLQQYYEYISQWCEMINYCSHTINGLNYCSKKKGHCIHTNPQLAAQQQQQLLQQQQQLPIQSQQEEQVIKMEG